MVQKRWRYLPLDRAGKHNYSRIQFSTNRKYPENIDDTKWSNPILVGSRKFKNLLLKGQIPIKEFPMYKISKGSRPYVYFDKNNLTTQGRQISKEAVEKLKNGTFVSRNGGYVWATLRFYAPLMLLAQKPTAKKKFTNDQNSHQLREITWDGQKNVKVYPLFRRQFKILCDATNLQKFLKQHKNPWLGKNSQAYEDFWDKLVRVNDPSLRPFDLDKNALDSVREVLIGFFEEFTEPTPDQLKTIEFPNAVAMDDISISHPLLETRPKEKICIPLTPHGQRPFYPRYGCLYRLLMETYYPLFQKLSKQYPDRRMYQDFCYETLWKIIHPDRPVPDENDEAWGLTFNQACRFFEKYRIKATLYDGFQGKPKCHYAPKTVNSLISPSHFRYVWSNDHAWLMDTLDGEPISKKFQYKKETVVEIGDQLDIDLKTNQSIPVSFNFSFLVNEKKPIHLLLDSVEKIVEYLNVPFEKEKPKEKNPQIIIITNLDLHDLFFTLRKQYNIYPQIDIRGGSINSFKLNNYLNKDVVIKQCYDPSVGQTDITDIKDYLLMDEFLDRIKKELLKTHNSSFYSSQVSNVFQEFKKGGLNGCFDYNENEECLFYDEDDCRIVSPNCGSSDFNRFYLSVLLSLEKIPIFNCDCYFEDYHGEPLEDLSLYVVEKTDDIFCYPFYHNDLCYGINLKHADSNLFEIKKVLRPASFQIVDGLRDIFDEVYKSNLPNQLKKNIGNIICGLLIQKRKNIYKSFFSSNLNEVQYFRQEIGGYIIPFKFEDKNVGYGYSKTFTRPLINGFYPIGLLVLDSTHFRMDQLRLHLEECGLSPYAIQTDCIYHQHDPDKYHAFKKKFPHYFDYENKSSLDAVGKIKYEVKNCGAWNPFEFKTFDFNFSTPSISKIDIRDEYDIDEFISTISNHSSLAVFGHGGYGKSTTLIRAFQKMGLKFLVLTKTHPLADKWISELKDYKDCSVQTVDSFFGLQPYSDIVFGNRFTSSQHYDVLLFDDSMLYDLRAIHQICILKIWKQQHHPELKLIANGDPLQLNMLLDKEKFKLFDGNEFDKLERLISRIFENVIFLKENKRLKSQVDKELNKQFIEICKKNDREAYMDFCSKHMNIVSKFSDIPMEVRKNIRHVITAQNCERALYNQMIYRMEHGFNPKWQVDQIVMVNRGKTARNKENKEKEFHPFQLFRIISVDKKKYTIQNILTLKELDISLDILEKKFTLPYARTCHSYQGNTINDVLVVVGFHHFYNDLRWFYTGDSRTTSFKNVWHIVEPSKMNETKKRYIDLNSKIKQYLEQDRKRFPNMKINMDRYITASWLELILKNPICTYCRVEDTSEDWTVDRIQNCFPHYKSNCVLACLDCNRSKK